MILAVDVQSELAALEKMEIEQTIPKTAMVIFAHPDDADFGCAGTAAGSASPAMRTVSRPTTGSGVGPNSVEDASFMPARLRAASMHAICMPKQMPK